jgi:uncharacterized damage-inducible protein DinB
MEIQEYIKLQIAGARNQCDSVLNAITNEQFNWTPPGTANPISATFVHMLASEDRSVQVTLQGKARLWETEGWVDKLGMKDPPGHGENWEEARSKNWTLLSLLGYEQSVRAATDAYLNNLTPQELDRVVIVRGNERSVADVLVRLVVHQILHTGEIDAVKGMMGMKGLAV